MAHIFLCLFILASLACPAHAKKPVDPCGVSPRPPVIAYIRLDRDIATFMAKHAQRACSTIDNFAHTNPARMNPALTAQLGNVKRKLRADLLEPIYAAYPGLRNVDVTSERAHPYEGRFNKEGSSKKSAERELSESRFSEASARYLSRILGETTKLIDVAADPMPAKADDQTGLTSDLHRDLLFEIIFIKTPVYERLRDDLKRRGRESVARPLSAAGAEYFRKTAPPPGGVRISPAALAHVRAVYDEVRKTPGSADDVMDISWVEHMGSKGPEDKEWTKYPPHVGLGGRSRNQVPVDVIRYYDGIPVVFGGDTRERFAGKLIDFNGKNLVIKEAAN